MARHYSSVKHPNRFYIFIAVLAILMGGMIYIFLRPSEHVFFARHYPLSQSLHLPELIIFSLPNGLWAFAYALIITRIWLGSKSWLKYFWMASIPVLVIGFEVLQLAGIISGTFSMQDIAFGLVGLVLGSIVGNKLFKSNNHEKSF